MRCANTLKSRATRFAKKHVFIWKPIEIFMLNHNNEIFNQMITKLYELARRIQRTNSQYPNVQSVGFRAAPYDG